MKENKLRFCTGCGGRLEEYCGQYFCATCGKVYNEVSKDVNFEDFTSDVEEETNFRKKETKSILRALLICIMTAIIIIPLINFFYKNFSSSDRAVKKVLEENGFSQETYKIESIIDLSSGIKGLPSGEDNKLVLVNHNDYYGYIIANTEYESVVIPVYGYVPLNVVQQKIWRMDKDKNIDCAYIFKEYIKKYGVNCMETKSYAEDYLCALTREGILSRDEARSIISNSTTSIFPNIKSDDEVTIFFDKYSAVPLYYATESTIMVYNWSSLWAEPYYEIVYSSLDKDTLLRIADIYGPPYIEKRVWAVVDSDLNEVGIYSSLDEIKEKLKID